VGVGRQYKNTTSKRNPIAPAHRFGIVELKAGSGGWKDDEPELVGPSVSRIVPPVAGKTCPAEV